MAVSKTRESEDASEKRLERRELSTIRRRAVGKLVAGIVLVLVGVAFFRRGGIVLLEQRTGIWKDVILISIGSMMIGFVVFYVTTPSSYYTRRIGYLGR